MMDEVILSMLGQYNNRTDEDYVNSLKEIIQQIALLGFWRSKFFEHAAFYGGTALRILYQLDRFSEDLDFSLLKANPDFELSAYLDAIRSELDSFGFETEISSKHKDNTSAIQSAFLKAKTKIHLMLIKAPEAIQQKYHSHQLMKIKFEVDTQPPQGFSTETISLFRPIPFWVRCYSLPDLFASKIVAALHRQWKHRIKGRDWYDCLWFIQRNTPVHLSHLEIRLRAFGYYTDDESLKAETVRQQLIKKVGELDIKLVKEDIAKFIKNPHRLEGWSKDTLIAAINELQFC